MSTNSNTNIPPSPAYPAITCDRCILRGVACVRRAVGSICARCARQRKPCRVLGEEYKCMDVDGTLYGSAKEAREASARRVASQSGGGGVGDDSGGGVGGDNGAESSKTRNHPDKMETDSSPAATSQGANPFSPSDPSSSLAPGSGSAPPSSNPHLSVEDGVEESLAKVTLEDGDAERKRVLQGPLKKILCCARCKTNTVPREEYRTNFRTLMTFVADVGGSLPHDKICSFDKDEVLWREKDNYVAVTDNSKEYEGSDRSRTRWLRIEEVDEVSTKIVELVEVKEFEFPPVVGKVEAETSPDAGLWRTVGADLVCPVHKNKDYTIFHFTYMPESRWATDSDDSDA